MQRIEKSTILLAAVILAAVQLLIPLIVFFSRDRAISAPQTAISEAEKKAAKKQQGTLLINVYNHQTGAVMELGLESYVLGVVAAEMPASYETEALKAQAVAARTVAAYNMARYPQGHPVHTGCAVCTSEKHCQAWNSEEEMQAKWGNDFEAYYGKIKQAVEETRGEIMLYQGEPIEVFYHAASNGYTEDVAEVFLVDLPYYQSVISPGEEAYSGYYGTVEMTRKQFVETIHAFIKNTGLTDKNLEKKIKIIDYTAGQRVRMVQLGDTSISGTEFRNLFGLKSACFTLSYQDNRVIIDTKGYGHGVGMSQAGAQAMATAGKSYRDILTHYYQGISLSSLSQ